MADSRRYVSTQQLDISQILLEAQQRWLRPNEVCEILRNYQRFYITPDPPYKPPGGSLFLFDRKALRYFRKDGHSWRKKKDGKTVREAHEKLKAGSVDVLHCYYAHGEDNENFQRRSYWMLDTKLEHIVLVHYREVKEGNRSGMPRLLHIDPGMQNGSAQPSSAPLLTQMDSPALVVQASYASSPSTADWNVRTPSSELDDVESGDDLGTSSLAENISHSGCLNGAHMHDTAGFSSSSTSQFGMGFGGACSIQFSSTSMWPEIHSASGNINSFQQPNIFHDRQNVTTDIITRKLTDSKLDTCNLLKDGIGGEDNVFPNVNMHTSGSDQEHWKYENGQQADYECIPNVGNGTFHFPKEHHFHFVHQPLQNNTGSHLPIDANGNSTSELNTHNNGSRELKKLDSFGRWMNKEIGGDCDDSLMASDSGNYWNSLDAQNEDKEVSSLSRQMQLDVGSLGPSLSQEQLFSIGDFSPEWAYSRVETKMLISGKILGEQKHPSTTAWCCMFGEVEVPAEVLTDNVLRCQTPLHTPGRVPFYITCSNRLACSEVREFEFRENPSNEILSMAVRSEPEDEMRLQIRLAKLLCTGLDKKGLDCSIEKCHKCNIKNKISSLQNDNEKEWGEIAKASMALEKSCENSRDALIQKLLKDRLYDWLVCKVHEEGKGPHVLDDEGLGVIHLAAALGYEWAMGPIVAAEVSPSFRDAHGRTGLHWAAYFGREETTVALVRLGAAPGAVDDPTSKFPGGQTAADLASSRGHKGIAGYLAEADLTSHLSSLTVKENVIESVAASIAAEKAVESVEEQNAVPSDVGGEGQSSMKGSLAAVRKSAQAAALIQASFRARSFRHRQLAKSSEEISEISTDLVALGYLNNKAQKTSHFSDSLHCAAIKIQQKYRGWKGRKEFLKIRKRIVKIQAHVRGHQVRKQYKKVIWSVSIVEKAILRWRRKGAGLRGFRANAAIGYSKPETEKIDEYEFLRLGRKQKIAGVEKALARVQSMVRYPEARDQYMRLVASFQKSKRDGEGSGSQI